VVEDTQSWHVEMEAVALTPGSPGDSIMVRLRIGGKVTRATVISKRRAVAANGFEVYR
jgi:flagella basal body P-ring formation protein FlgA